MDENDAGDVVGIGHRSRSIPERMRLMLSLRDGGCRYPPLLAYYETNPAWVYKLSRNFGALALWCAQAAVPRHRDRHAFA